LKANNETFVEY